MEATPSLCSVPAPSLLPDWIKGGSNVTLFLNSMTKPKHGKLFFDDANDVWTFCPGNTTDLTKSSPLVDLSSTSQQLLDTGQLFQGHAKFHLHSTCSSYTRRSQRRKLTT